MFNVRMLANCTNVATIFQTHDNTLKLSEADGPEAKQLDNIKPFKSGLAIKPQ